MDVIENFLKIKWLVVPYECFCFLGDFLSTKGGSVKFQASPIVRWWVFHRIWTASLLKKNMFELLSFPTLPAFFNARGDTAPRSKLLRCPDSMSMLWENKDLGLPRSSWQWWAAVFFMGIEQYPPTQMPPPQQKSGLIFRSWWLIKNLNIPWSDGSLRLSAGVVLIKDIRYAMIKLPPQHGVEW